MPITLLATQIPVPVVASGVYDISGGGITSKNLAIGDTAALRTKVNENAARSDLVARYGGGVYGVCTGLDLSAGTGLNASVAAGVAMIDGVVEFPTAQTVAVTASGRNHLWLRRTGALTSVFSSLTAPGADYCYIGSVVTSSTVVTSVDQSGVLYLLGGLPKRLTADTTTPADTPPATVSFIHYGVGKVWLWSGTAYWQIAATVSGMPLAQLVKSVSASFTFTAAELLSAGDIELNNGGIGATFTATWPSTGLTAGQYWIVTNNTGQAAILKVAAGNDTWLSAGARRVFMYDGSELRRVHNPQVGSPSIAGASSPNWEDIEQERQEYSVSGGSQTVTWPTSLVNKARMHSIRNDNSGTNALTIKASGAAAVHDTLLLPGEETLTVLGSDGIIRPAITRPRTRRVVLNFATDADKTIAHPDFLATTLDMTDTGVVLTIGRNVILPTVTDKSWVCRNQTAQTLTFKTAAGGGVAIATNKTAFVECDGTAIFRVTPDA